VKVELGVDFNADRERLSVMAERIVYTGPLDAYFDFCYGNLDYRGLKFDTKRFDTDNYQGVAVMNFTDGETPYTRVIEHKHFEFGTQSVTHVTWEYPEEWSKGDEPYYPVNDQKNEALKDKYMALSKQHKNVIFGGRLAEYRYYDMDKTIASALDTVKREFGE
jgi:UDP-galactopyranose mutase